MGEGKRAGGVMEGERTHQRREECRECPLNREGGWVCPEHGAKDERDRTTRAMLLGSAGLISFLLLTAINVGVHIQSSLSELKTAMAIVSSDHEKVMKLEANMLTLYQRLGQK